MDKQRSIKHTYKTKDLVTQLVVFFVFLLDFGTVPTQLVVFFAFYFIFAKNEMLVIIQLKINFRTIHV
jgi:hypothetical protein